MAQTTEPLKEYKILNLASNGWNLVDDSALNLTKEQASKKFWDLVNGGENPDRLKIVWQEDPRYPTKDASSGYVPQPD